MYDGGIVLSLGVVRLAVRSRALSTSRTVKPFVRDASGGRYDAANWLKIG
jgi:hypothetical protein